MGPDQGVSARVTAAQDVNSTQIEKPRSQRTKRKKRTPNESVNLEGNAANTVSLGGDGVTTLVATKKRTRTDSEKIESENVLVSCIKRRKMTMNIPNAIETTINPRSDLVITTNSNDASRKRARKTSEEINVAHISQQQTQNDRENMCKPPIVRQNDGTTIVRVGNARIRLLRDHRDMNRSPLTSSERGQADAVMYKRRRLMVTGHPEAQIKEMPTQIPTREEIASQTSSKRKRAKAKANKKRRNVGFTHIDMQGNEEASQTENAINSIAPFVSSSYVERSEKIRRGKLPMDATSEELMCEEEQADMSVHNDEGESLLDVIARLQEEERLAMLQAHTSGQKRHLGVNDGTRGSELANAAVTSDIVESSGSTTRDKEPEKVVPSSPIITASNQQLQNLEAQISTSDTTATGHDVHGAPESYKVSGVDQNQEKTHETQEESREISSNSGTSDIMSQNVSTMTASTSKPFERAISTENVGQLQNVEDEAPQEVSFGPQGDGQRTMEEGGRSPVRNSGESHPVHRPTKNISESLVKRGEVSDLDMETVRLAGQKRQRSKFLAGREPSPKRIRLSDPSNSRLPTMTAQQRRMDKKRERKRLQRQRLRKLMSQRKEHELSGILIPQSPSEVPLEVSTQSLPQSQSVMVADIRIEPTYTFMRSSQHEEGGVDVISPSHPSPPGQVSSTAPIFPPNRSTDQYQGTPSSLQPASNVTVCNKVREAGMDMSPCPSRLSSSSTSSSVHHQRSLTSSQTEPGTIIQNEVGLPSSSVGFIIQEQVSSTKPVSQELTSSSIRPTAQYQRISSSSQPMSGIIAQTGLGLPSTSVMPIVQEHVSLVAPAPPSSSRPASQCQGLSTSLRLTPSATVQNRVVLPISPVRPMDQEHVSSTTPPISGPSPPNRSAAQYQRLPSSSQTTLTDIIQNGVGLPSSSLSLMVQEQASLMAPSPFPNSNRPAIQCQVSGTSLQPSPSTAVQNGVRGVNISLSPCPSRLPGTSSGSIMRNQASSDLPHPIPSSTIRNEAHQQAVNLDWPPPSRCPLNSSGGPMDQDQGLLTLSYSTENRMDHHGSEGIGIAPNVRTPHHTAATSQLPTPLVIRQGCEDEAHGSRMDIDDDGLHTYAPRPVRGESSDPVIRSWHFNRIGRPMMLARFRLSDLPDTSYQQTNPYDSLVHNVQSNGSNGPLGPLPQPLGSGNNQTCGATRSLGPPPQLNRSSRPSAVDHSNYEASSAYDPQISRISQSGIHNPALHYPHVYNTLSLPGPPPLINRLTRPLVTLHSLEHHRSSSQPDHGNSAANSIGSCNGQQCARNSLPATQHPVEVPYLHSEVVTNGIQRMRVPERNNESILAPRIHFVPRPHLNISTYAPQMEDFADEFSSLSSESSDPPSRAASPPQTSHTQLKRQERDRNERVSSNIPFIPRPRISATRRRVTWASLTISAKKAFKICTYEALRQVWGIEARSQAHKDAVEAGAVLHEDHVELWRDAPPEQIRAQFVDPHSQRVTHRIPVDYCIPNWKASVNSAWNKAVFDSLSKELHRAILDGLWDDVVDDLARVRDQSREDYLAHNFEKRFYRFRVEYKEQKPVSIADTNQRRRAIEQRLVEISIQHDKVRRRTRWDSRRSTLANERISVIPKVQDIGKREALEKLLLAIHPAALEKSSRKKKRHPAATLMSGDESDPESTPTSRNYFINTAAWRDKQITTAIRFLDTKLPQHRPDRSAGNVFRTRSFSQDIFRVASLMPANKRGWVCGAPVGLPINFYDSEWLMSLSEGDRSRLGLKDRLVWDLTNVFR